MQHEIFGLLLKAIQFAVTWYKDGQYLGRIIFLCIDVGSHAFKVNIWNVEFQFFLLCILLVE